MNAHAEAEVYTVLLGGAIDASLHGTTDSTFYTHYSTISTVSSNWDLPSLGRWDCDANVFALVANKTGYKNVAVDTTNLYLNVSYPGALSDSKFTPGWWPAPDTQAKCANGKGVLDSIVKTWARPWLAWYRRPMRHSPAATTLVHCRHWRPCARRWMPSSTASW